MYVLLLVPLWGRIASWSATVLPKPGIAPVSEAELRQRLLAINETDSPLQFIEGKKGKMDIVWRLAIDNAYRYTFNSAEMKSPVMQIVRNSGWRYKPVIVLSRWLSG